MSELATPLLVLVHGAWHGAWEWDPVLPLLAEAGIEAMAVDLAGVGRGPGRHDLIGHAAALRAEIDASDRAVVLCGHSYGGAVMTQAAAGTSNVAHLVYVAAFQLMEGESCADANLPPPVSPEGIGPVLDGDYLSVSAATARHMFYEGCPPNLVAAAVERLTPEHTGTVRGPVSAAAWREIPSTYIVCERDRALTPAAQHRMAERATARHVLDHPHSPMLGIPADLAALLADLFHKTVGGRFAPTGTGLGRHGSNDRGRDDKE